MEYKKLFTEVTEIVNEIDPMDLVKGGAPPDEYSSEVAKILVELKSSASQDDFVKRLEKIFDPRPDRNIYKILAGNLFHLKNEINTK